MGSLGSKLRFPPQQMALTWNPGGDTERHRTLIQNIITIRKLTNSIPERFRFSGIVNLQKSAEKRDFEKILALWRRRTDALWQYGNRR